MKSNSDFTETRFQPGEQLLVKHNNTEIVYTVASYRIHKGFHMLRFEGINNINEIEHLKGDYIYQERDHQDIELENMNTIIRILLVVQYLKMMIRQLVG